MKNNLEGSNSISTRKQTALHKRIVHKAPLKRVLPVPILPNVMSQDKLQRLCRLLSKFKNWGDLDLDNFAVKKNYKNGKHAESVALLENLENGSRVIKKRYKREHLNIFYNEVLQLSKLTECSFAPTLLKVDPTSRTLYMSYCGQPIKRDRLDEYKDDIDRCKKELKLRWNIYHNDIKPGNICLLSGDIYFIDFGWASNKKLKPGYGTGRAGYKNQSLFLA